MQFAIIVFAKAPVPGNVKTRLVPPLTPVEAAELHRSFVRDTLRNVAGISATIELHTDTGTDAFPDLFVTRKLQITGDLGLKMFHALSTALDSGAERAIILGADSPTLPRTHIDHLLSATSDIAFGPAEDGGYYAIAVRRVDPAMFDGVQWGTADALERSRKACEGCGLTTSLGEEWFDIDQPKDLKRLLASRETLPLHTRSWLDHARQDLVDAIEMGLDFVPVGGFGREP